MAAVIFVLLILRRPECVTNPQFWAEDGTLFFRSQLILGFKASVLSAYSGYLCVLQYTIAALVSVFPVYYAPMIYALAGSALDAACCSLFILPIFRNIIRSDWLRAAVCILTAVTPPAGELVGTLVNTQWYGLLGGTLLLFRQALPIGGAGARVAARGIGWGLLGLLMALTNPVLILGIPFCLWNLARGWRADRWYEAGLLLGLAIQLSIFAASSQATANLTHDRNLPALATAVAVAFVYRAIVSLVIGFKLALTAAIAKSLSVPAIACGAFVVLEIGVLWKAGVRDRWKIAIVLYVAASSLGITLGGRNIHPAFANIRDFQGFYWERYMYLASCAFIYLMAISIDVLFAQRRLPIQIAVLASVFALGIVSNYRIPHLPDKHWRLYAPLIQERLDHHQIGPGYPRIVVPILPEGWEIIL